ncbi:AAA family ATPase [Nitrobacter vulgaris]|uniref:AAA family ATPase n=1 Tax=Nitrobacter vulgaris TaxID=29421 RepID=UPI00286CDFFC|nr:AAA family ATPase [Nitrobacter vulgaris]
MSQSLAEIEFEPTPEDNPKGWFVNDPAPIDYTFNIFRFVVSDPATRQYVCGSHWDELDFASVYDPDTLLPGCVSYVSAGTAKAQDEVLLEAGVPVDTTRKERWPKDTLVLDVGLVTKIDELAGLRTVWGRSLGVKFGSQYIARCEGSTKIDSLDAIFDLHTDMTAPCPIGYQPHAVPDPYCDSYFLVRDGERASAFLKRVAVRVKKIEEELALLSECGYDAPLLASIRAEQHSKPGPVRFLVESLIPTNCITLLGGKRKTGKSTAVTELAFTVATGGGAWCGFDVPKQEGFVVLFGGEDSRAVIWERLNRMAAGCTGLERLIIYGNETTNLKATLARYAEMKICLIVVDPTRKYYSGDEDGSDAPNELFNFLESQAEAHNCALLVTHHPRKDAEPRNMTELAASLRGSSIFLDRPRVTIGLMRKGEETVVGIPTDRDGNPLHNMPVEHMFRGERVCKRDETTHRLIPIQRQSDTSSTARSDSMLALQSLDSLYDKGIYVTKSGKHGLFENWPKEIQSISRARVHAACELLLANGEITLSENGLHRRRDPGLSAGR